MRALTLAIVTVFLVFIPRNVAAGDHGEHEKHHGKHHGDEDDHDDREHHGRYGDACLRDGDLRILYDYYQPRGLPPGLQKKLYRTGQLPPGWSKRVQPFPYVVEERLPPVCYGCARGYVDGYAVVYQPRTGVVIDFHAVFGQ